MTGRGEILGWMSEENVNLVRRLFEAYQRADFPAIAECSDDEFEFTSVLTAVEETSYRGKDGLAAYWADMNEAWEEWQIELVAIHEGHADDVVVITRLTGRGKSSGVPVDRTIGIRYRIRDGRLWRMESYLDPAECLEAAGLSE
jgi:ketosteroid isomerase-like protein